MLARHIRSRIRYAPCNRKEIQFHGKGVFAYRPESGKSRRQNFSRLKFHGLILLQSIKRSKCSFDTFLSFSIIHYHWYTRGSLKNSHFSRHKLVTVDIASRDAYNRSSIVHARNAYHACVETTRVSRFVSSFIFERISLFARILLLLLLLYVSRRYVQLEMNKISINGQREERLYKGNVRYLSLNRIDLFPSSPPADSISVIACKRAKFVSRLINPIIQDGNLFFVAAKCGPDISVKPRHTESRSRERIENGEEMDRENGRYEQNK